MSHLAGLLSLREEIMVQVTAETFPESLIDCILKMRVTSLKWHFNVCHRGRPRTKEWGHTRTQYRKLVEEKTVFMYYIKATV